ncbi:PLP-dependent decarboxylase [Pseudoalteromonas ruthenica]|uniref:Diaminopimelate decarboxylase n=1 Tax=Pseudoalteromonas ruthenica TaxID=151081 RepID=A0A0F4PUK7_9GAMM|nr:PLP-dependent decarboxylase [Pseudoalteromonas ruthenica]KJY95133.1 diaminopimelate decarboxylase [Pseudoalteromonas ruthenica]KJY98814.1 diaminopimelate decarboxylase [Pseudoalteromonas ruthenica]TMO85983.1 PLP-dependent decarboxylase [Pseudoalteromonas ruthenica]TMO93627.1 PLP-dependent decarboxylase [Pseudoalteromonas ruthenica]TMO97669.1 PLP-dependent decarboxylase [Pseudoalteromonas ruthenica]
MPVSGALLNAFDTLTQERQEPCFVYDLDSLRKHLDELMAQDVVKLWYAVKANPLSAVIDTLAAAGFDFDVASSGELNQVLSQHVGAQRILNTGPAKSRQQLGEFLDAGVRTFVLESINQVRWLNELAYNQGIEVDVLLRVQLRWPEGERNPLGGNTLTPFGLAPEQWQGLYLADYPALNCIGLHIFQWGNMLDAAQLLHLWQSMLAPLQALCERLGFAMQVLDLGGGLGVPYDSESSPLKWQDVLGALRDIKRQSGVKELWMELGRYAVAQCGYYLDPVIEQKTNYGERQLIVAGGINHLLRPAVAGQNFPAQLLRRSTAEQVNYRIHGPLCTALDSLGQHSLPEDIDEHDWLVFMQAGAYGFTESMPFFLCHSLAGEYVFEHGTLRVVREPQPASFYLR